MSFVREKLDKDGLEIEYIKFGKGDRTLAIIPGLSVQSVLSAGIEIEKRYEPFAEDFTVYLFDRRLNNPEPYSVYDMADDTAKAMKLLGLKGSCIFGASQGGMIAMCLAIKYPELVTSFAVASTSAFVDINKSGVIEEWISLAKSKDTEALYLKFGEKVYPKAVFEQYKDLFVQAAATVTENDLRRFVTFAEGCFGYDIREALKSVNCPALVIGDEQDAVLGVKAYYTIKESLKGNYYLYNGFGHAVYDTAPDFPQRLREFFK